MLIGIAGRSSASSNGSLARAKLHAIEVHSSLSDQVAKIARLKAEGKDTMEAEQTLGLFEMYLAIIERHRDFFLRQQKAR